MAVMPKIYIEPTHIEKTTHHIQASTCIIRWPVATFGMLASGLYFRLIIELYIIRNIYASVCYRAGLTKKYVVIGMFQGMCKKDEKFWLSEQGV